MNLLGYIYQSIVTVMYCFALPIIVVLGKFDGDFNRYLIYTIARCYGYSPELAIWLVKQSNHETAYQTSRLSNEANNLFGMKMPRKRETRAYDEITAKEGQFAMFKTKADSVIDRIMWDDYWNINHDSYIEVSDYEAQLDGLYAEAVKYPSKVRNTEERFLPNAGKISTIIYSILCLVVVTYYKFRK